jgi:cytochrome c oxidase subunit II
VRAPRAAALLLTALAAAACTGPQNALDTAGPAAARIATLWWVMLALALAVSLLVAVLLAYAVRTSRRRALDGDAPEVDGVRLVWAGGVAMPVVVLFGVLVYNYRVGVEVHAVPGDPADAVVVEVVGHQFWWEVRYPELGITTANEIRSPAGRPVRFVLTSPDVIHSFWVPRLHGKIDMIPGRVNHLWLRADEPGRFRGQCAEFCGLSHALMAFWVEALPPDGWEAWVGERRAPRPEPAAPEVARGREVFVAAGCGDCHASRGLPLPPELGTVGPDLEDLATRRTLAAGILPNTPEAMRGWIADPQRHKPGSRMPPTPLDAEQMQALLAYLASLR